MQSIIQAFYKSEWFAFREEDGVELSQSKRDDTCRERNGRLWRRLFSIVQRKRSLLIQLEMIRASGLYLRGGYVTSERDECVPPNQYGGSEKEQKCLDTRSFISWNINAPSFVRRIRCTRTVFSCRDDTRSHSSGTWCMQGRKKNTDFSCKWRDVFLKLQ